MGVNVDAGVGTGVVMTLALNSKFLNSAWRSVPHRTSERARRHFQRAVSNGKDTPFHRLISTGEVFAVEHAGPVSFGPRSG